MAEGPSERLSMDSDGSSDLDVFGSHLSDADWLKRVRQAQATKPLGRLGPYELIEEINRGAQGVVFRARQPNTNRDVALKRLLAGSFATPLMRGRFEREVEAVTSLNHPNVVTVYGMEMVDGQPLLAMEWIDGQAVDQWAAGNGHGRRNACEILNVFVLICDAVNHAHQRGVIHRDLKPSNILIDENGQPRVLDFGLAKLTSVDDSGQAGLTLTKDFIGTPAYASPEQAAGKQDEVDIRTDVYALGVILFHLLTGKLPYRSGLNIAELLLAIQNNEPDRPSKIVSTIESDIDAIVLKALAKDPQQRYQSVDALAADVKRFLTGEAVLAHAPSAAYQLRKLMRRHRLAFAFGATVLTLVLAFGIVATVLATKLYDEQQHALLESGRATEARETAVAINNFVQTMLAAVEPENEGIDVTVLQVLNQAAERIEIDLVDQPEVELGVRNTIGSAYAGLGQYPEALPHLRRAYELSEELFPADDPTLAKNMGRLAELLKRMGRLDDAEDLFRKSLDILRDAYGEEHHDVAAAMNSLALVLYSKGGYDEARPLYRRALQIHERLSGPGTAEVADTLNNLAGLLYAKGDYAGAEAMLNDVVELTRELRGPKHLSLLRTLNNLAGLRMMRGNYTGAEPLFRKVLEQYDDIYGAEHPRIATTLNNLAEVLRLQDRAAESEPVQRRCLAMRRKLLGDEHPAVAKSMNNLGLVLMAQGRLEESAALHRETLALRRRILGVEHPHVATSLHNLAFALRRLGQLEESEALAREAVALREKLLGDNHPLVATSLGSVATTLAALGRVTEAEELVRRAIAIQREKLGQEHPDYASSLSQLGGLLVADEKYEEAEPLLREALKIEGESLPAGSSRAAQSAIRLGTCLTGLGRFTEAETLLLDGYQALHARHGAEHKDTQGALRHIVDHYLARGNHEQAATYRLEILKPESPAEQSPR